MTYDQLRQLSDLNYQNTLDGINEEKIFFNSLYRTIDICEQNDLIMNQIESDFLEKTKLSKKDIPFLFFAVALQTARWILLPSLDLEFSKIDKKQRLNSNEVRHGGDLDGTRSGRRFEKPEINKYKNNHRQKYELEQNEYKNKIKGQGKYEYLSWIEILFNAVPYDAMNGSEYIQIQSRNLRGKTTFFSPIGKKLNGVNHHVATLGHDPILGWIFGTMNIASSMITFCDFQTYPVCKGNQLDKWNQSIDYLHQSSIIEMFNYCINSFKEDYKRIPAAVARQAIHMKSDKYTKNGLQIPLLSPDIAQDFINKGWNSNEMERLFKKVAKNVGTVSTQFLVAEMINQIIRSIYLIVNHDKEFNYSKVKIEKILKIASIIAESSNIIAVIVKKDISILDIGGLISMIYRIAIDSKTRIGLEVEYINSEFERILMEDI